MDWTKIINEGVLPLVTAALLGFCAVLLRAAVKWFEAKTAIAVDTKTEQMLSDMVESGVHRAEEWARGEAKRQLGASTAPHNEKLARAVDFAIAEMERRRMPKRARAEGERAGGGRLR